MSTHVARGHGGDGGDRPPHGGSNRIDSTCEASAKKINVRGKGRNMNLYEEYKKNDCQPLPVDIDFSGRTYRFIGDYVQLLVRLISNEVGERVTFNKPSWARVPLEERDPIFNTLRKFFDFDQWKDTSHWDGVRAGVREDCRRAYKERKHAFKSYFDRVGGYADVEKTRSFPPGGMSSLDWNLVIERFLSSSFRNISKANKSNRAKRPYQSAHGCTSYAQRRHKEKQQGIKPRHLEGWKEMHFKESTGWCNDRARQDWENIQEALREMQEEVGEGGEVDEVEVLKRGLGKRRGYARGVGRQPSFDSSFSRASTSKSKKSRNSQNENASKAELRELRKSVGDFFKQLKAHIPNLDQLPIPAQFLGDTSSVNAPEDSYGEDDEESDEESDEEYDEAADEEVTNE